MKAACLEPGRSLVGCLLQFDMGKRTLFHATAPPYPQFDGQVCPCLGRGENADFISIKWLKPVEYHGRRTKKSSFQSSNFIIVGRVGEKK